MKDNNSICIIAGSGPSLKAIDLLLTRNFPLIAFNYSHRFWNALPLDPVYYACLDPMAIADGHSELCDLRASRPELRMFLHATAIRYGFKNDAQVQLLDLCSSDSIKVDRNNITDLGSGPATIIPVLREFKHKKFILIGIDARYSAPRGLPEETPGIVRVTEDYDHFDPNYGTGKRRWALPDLGVIFSGWQKLAHAQSELGIEIINASPGSALEFFPRKSLLEAIGAR